ncbi:MAG: hypothetical protein OSB46_02890 [Alphaproteobacteria bacterium]|nr:hypothetical protein [Alphaproteobacteria bacterium]
MQDLTIQGFAPPPLSPAAKYFSETAGEIKTFGAAAGGTPATPKRPKTLSDGDQFYLEIMAEEDASIEIMAELLNAK